VNPLTNVSERRVDTTPNRSEYIISWIMATVKVTVVATSTLV
jgi:hypothetical protein